VIPRANITAWRAVAPWPANEQVEQDLVLSRALVVMFGEKDVADRVVFRGGTAFEINTREHFAFFGTTTRKFTVENPANLAAKLVSAPFTEDLRLLVPPEIEYDPAQAAKLVAERLNAKLPGEPWRSAQRP
jgi:hypothetical protein